MQDVQQPQLTEMERLLNHSLNGIHILFDHDAVKKILKRPTEELDFFSLKNIDRIQTLFTAFAEKKNLREKQAYLQSLDEESYEIIVRTYFHIVDSTLQSSFPVKH